MVTGTALLLALGVILPFVFHVFPLGGRIFLPMHLPTFVAGLVLGPVAGLIVGAGSPVLSMLLLGRPPIIYMVPMLFELATYGVVAGLLRPRIAAFLARRRRSSADRIGSSMAPVMISLVVAMIAGRIVWIAVVVWLAPFLGITARTVVMALGALGAGWIGMAIQIVLIPAIVRAIERARNP